MSDVDKSGAGGGGYVIVALITAGVVYALMSQTKPVQAVPSASSYPTQEAAPVPVVTPAPIPRPLATPKMPPLPTHRYASVEGSTYYYGAAVSEDERKSGKQAPDMLAFWYLGKDAEGRDLIQDVVNGSPRGVSNCSRPCRVIHDSNGTTVGFDSGSIIGAAFDDAQRGFLRKHSFPKPAPEPDYPWPNDPAVPAPETSN